MDCHCLPPPRESRPRHSLVLSAPNGHQADPTKIPAESGEIGLDRASQIIRPGLKEDEAFRIREEESGCFPVIDNFVYAVEMLALQCIPPMLTGVF